MGDFASAMASRGFSTSVLAKPLLIECSLFFGHFIDASPTHIIYGHIIGFIFFEEVADADDV
jgi:hypothetical protein